MLLFSNVISSQSFNLPIVPSPQKVYKLNGNYQFKAKTIIAVSSDDNASLKISAEEIQSSLKNSLKINSTITTETSGDITLEITSFLNKIIPIDNDEAYELSIDKNKIIIKAKTAKGIYYGAMSLIQLIEKADHNKIPSVNIIDWPDLKVRGISDDISRGQVSTVKNFKRIIDFISRYKMNTYMLYLEDMLQFDAYPSIGKGRGRLTKDEVKEIVSYAKEHFIEVVPIFQTLGHYENILTQDKFLKYAEFPGAASLNVSNDSIYIFLDNMLKEVFELFPSKYFHMGADESYDVGLGASKYLVDSTDIATVHANHYKKIYNICKKYGKTVLMYGDIILKHPEILSKIPKDIIIVDWHYRPSYNYPSAKTFNDEGFKYYVSPSSWNFLTPFPANINALPNIKYFIKTGLENNASGMINSNWGDYGAETFKEFILFDYAWSAQCSWNFNESNIETFSKNYFYDFFGVNDPGFTDVYKTLSDPINQMLWHDVWRHPLLDFRKPAWWEPQISEVSKITWNNWANSNLLEQIKKLKNEAIKNKDHFDLLEFIVKLNKWYQLKISTQEKLHDSLFVNNHKSELIDLVDQNIKTLKQLEDEFSGLWLLYYKKDNLNLIQDKFERLIAYFSETRELINKNLKTLPSPLLESKWIYVPKDDSNFADKADFKTEFNLDASPKEAYLQLLADTYAKLYINGQYVDRVFAKRSGSLSVDYKRIKFLDIIKYLKAGENTISVHCENFNRDGFAGINIISQIITPNDTLKVLTESKDNWLGKAEDGTWEDVKEKDYSYEIIAPNFATKRTSWIER